MPLLPIALVAQAALTPWVDAHAHYDERDPEGSARIALGALQRENAVAIVLMTPPDTFDHPGHSDSDAMLVAAKPHRGKLMVAGGGGTLNAIIQQMPADAVDARVRKQFEDRAEE